MNMRAAMENQDSIAKRIVEGSLTFDSVQDFEKTLAIFPNNPGVHRAYGDMLAGTKDLDAAVRAYHKACRLFVDQGMMLQALVAKILEWRLAPPSHDKARRFHATLMRIESGDLPLKGFITQMTYPEMIAFMMKLVRVRFPAQRRIKKCGDVENHLYFIVSGVLKETSYPPTEQGANQGNGINTDLVENQFFGRIYPFDQQRRSQSDVETITPSELVKISSERLQGICKQYPKLETLVKALYEEKDQAPGTDTSPAVRKTTRHQLPTKANIKIFFKGPNNSPLVFDGFTEDISVGGTCFVLGDTYRSGPPGELVGATAKLQVSLPNAGASLNILSNIVWGKEITGQNGTSVALGLQFKDMDHHTQAQLSEYCSGSDGEQNLILSLWESYIKP